MRKIKFRAWNRLLKIMVNDHCDFGPFGIDAPTFQRKDVMVRGDEYEWMQYTGLKDMNDVEIYEGDIVLYSPIHEFDTNYPTVIKWQNAGFNISGSAATYHKVIGNIYENPDLVK